MSYLFILEKVEEGRLTVKQAIKEIEKESKRQQKHHAKKIKLCIVDDERTISLPGVSFGFVKVFLKLCAPFIQLDHDQIQDKFNKEELDTMLINLEEVLKVMKEYPPLELIHIKSKDKVVKIVTK